MPAELLNHMLSNTLKGALTKFARTCKAANNLAQSPLFHSIYTCRLKEGFDSKSLVLLLRQRPDVVSLLRALWIDEWYAIRIRALLAIKFPI